VIQQLLYRRGGAMRQRPGSMGLVALFVRASELLQQFEEFELVSVPRSA